MTETIIVKDCDGHTQRVTLKETSEGVRFWIDNRKRSARLVKRATIAQVKQRMKTQGAF